MEIIEVTTLVALFRMIRSHPIPIFVIHICLLVVVGVFVVIVGNGIDHSCGRCETFTFIGETEKIIVSIERADALHKLHAPPFLLDRQIHHFHSTSQTATCQIDGGGTMIEASLINEIGRNGGEIECAQHG